MEGFRNITVGRVLALGVSRSASLRQREPSPSATRPALILILITVFLLCACGGRQPGKYGGKSGKGAYYTVKAGETLGQIARSHKITAQQIAEWNNIQDPDRVSAGMRIYIPRGRSGSRKKFDVPLAFDRERFRWPVRGGVISGFGMRDGNRHDGVDIKAPVGAPIFAAADGKVVYSGNLRGYGNLIILRHADRYYTTYAHNQKNRVKVGQAVGAGEAIARVGATGRATGPHLHFEVRLGATARNPLFFMPTDNNAGDSEVRLAKGKGKAKFKKFVKKKSVDKKISRKP